MAKAVPHGTLSRYANNGCRCDECKDATAVYQKRHQAQPCAAGCGRAVWGKYRPGTMCRACRAATWAKPLVHGTSNAYDRKGCRCDECRAAAADDRRGRRRRAKARAA